MRSALFRAVTQRVPVIPYRRFGTTSTPSSRVKNTGPIGCPETSVRNYQYSLHNNPEERSSHLLHDRSLKSYSVFMCSVRITEQAAIISLYNINCLTLVNFQLDAQNSYLFIYNTFIKIFYMFRALPCSFSGGLRSNCIYASPGIVTLCT